MSGVWPDVWAERKELADMLESVSDEEWDTSSLYDRWKVRDVVGYLVLSADPLGFARVLIDIVKARFNMTKMLEVKAIEAGRHPPEDLLKQLREASISEYTPPLTSSVTMLSDIVVHVQDIRRPLNRPRTIPEHRLRVALDAMKGTRFMGNKKRIAGVSLMATDIEWANGKGPSVRGTGEALLMAMCGRGTVIDELTGDGVETLRSR